MKFLSLSLIVLLAVTFFLTSCRYVKKVSEEEVLSYLNNAYDDDFEIVSIGKAIDPKNFKQSLSDNHVVFSSKKLGNYHYLVHLDLVKNKDDGFKAFYNYYISRRVGRWLSKKIEKELFDSDYDWVLDIEVNLELLEETKHIHHVKGSLTDERMDELSKKFFQEKVGLPRAVILVHALDVRENEEKYFKLCLDFLEGLEKREITISSLDIFFMDGKVKDLEKHVTYDFYPSSDQEIYQHVLELWRISFLPDYYQRYKEDPELFFDRSRSIYKFQKYRDGKWVKH